MVQWVKTSNAAAWVAADGTGLIPSPGQWVKESGTAAATV